MKAGIAAFTALFFILVSNTLASPAKRSERLDKRINARLAAQKSTAQMTGHTTFKQSPLSSHDSPHPVDVSGQTSLYQLTSRHTLHQVPSRYPSVKAMNDIPMKMTIKVGGKILQRIPVQVKTTSRANHISSMQSSPSSNIASSSVGNLHSIESLVVTSLSDVIEPSKADVRFNDQHGKAPSVFTMPKTRFIIDPRHSARQQKKDYFEKIWKEHNLGMHMPAHALVDSVKMMSAAGLDAQSGKMLAMHKLKDAPSQEYRDAYTHRARQWTVAVNNSKQRLTEKDPTFAKLDKETKHLRAYQRASQTIDNNKYSKFRTKTGKRLIDPGPRYGKAKQRAEERQSQMEEVGRAFREHLAKHDMDFDSMTTKQLEVASRGLSNPPMKLQTYSKLLVEYIGRYRPESDIMHFRDERIKHNMAKSKEANRKSFDSDARVASKSPS